MICIMTVFYIIIVHDVFLNPFVPELCAWSDDFDHNSSIKIKFEKIYVNKLIPIWKYFSKIIFENK